MYKPNEALILAALNSSDVVLDIGGWASCFNRANWVMDTGTYETRNFFGTRPSLGGEREFFSKDSWIVRDVCDRRPYPFKDKEVDFVVCSHTLEDLRDPLWVCNEMIRIARRGYIEVPSRLIETCRGVEGRHAGHCHHRWLIDIHGSHIRFLSKFHTINSDPLCSLPSRHQFSLKPQDRVQWLLWTDGFTYEETTIHGTENIRKELADYVRGVRACSEADLRREFFFEMSGWSRFKAGRLLDRLLAAAGWR